MTSADAWALVLAGILLLLATVLAVAETALAHVSRLRVEELVRDGRRGTERLERVVRDAATHLNVLLLARTAAEMLAATLAAIVCERGLGSIWQATLVAGVGMAVLHYVLVGVAARSLGRQHSEGIALLTSRLVIGLGVLTGPVARVLIGVGSALVPGKIARDSGFTSEAELRDMVDLAEERQVIESSEREMIHSVFELGETLAREVMVPRTDMVWIERNKTIRHALSLALRSGFSRIPVIGDNEDDIVGIAYLKDLARRAYDGDGQTTERVEDAMRPPYLIPDSKPVDELLRDMQAKQVHVAVVIDEYGGTAGLVTIEDILEEIVGEITDEYDREGPRVEHLDDGSVRVSVRLSIDDLKELFNVEFELEDVETVGGLLAAELGRVPIAGATVDAHGLRFTAEGAKGRRNRVGTVLIVKLPIRSL
ncbi:MAG TPA: hemolysin family protein [Mycobacteriales bacterium]|jgi:CBS domain containing-hemolysin-like protein|nr:hemolysin family protein [Mycobacteriales bacterium]